MKKVGTILLAALLGASMTAVFAGCGEEGPQDTATTKVVKVWLHKSPTEEEGRTYQGLQTLFNEAHHKTQDGRDIVMSIEFKNNSDTLQQAINAENSMGGAGLPDVFAVDAPSIANYADSRTIVPIGEYLSDEVKSDYVDSVIEQSTIDGQLYALSGADAPAGLYYNKSLLEQAGIEPGTIEDPWSWKDLAEAIRTLQGQGLTYKINLSFGFGGNEGLMYLHAPLVYSAGGTFADADGKVKPCLTSGQSLAGLNMLTEFMIQAKGDPQNVWSYTGTNENAFPAGEAAFQIFGPWLIRTINKNYPAFKDQYDIMPYPVYEDAQGKKGSVATPCGSWGFAVSSAARDKEAAAQVVAYLTETEASEMLYNTVGTFPTHRSLLEDTEEFGSGALKSLATLLTDTAKARPKLKNYNDLRDAYAAIIDYINTHAGEGGFDLLNTISTQCDSVDR